MAGGILPSRHKMLRASIVVANIFGAYAAQSGSLGPGRSLTETAVADGPSGSLILAVLPRQGLQSAIGGQWRKTTTRPVGIDLRERLSTEIDRRARRLRRTAREQKCGGDCAWFSHPESACIGRTDNKECVGGRCLSRPRAGSLAAKPLQSPRKYPIACRPIPEQISRRLVRWLPRTESRDCRQTV